MNKTPKPFTVDTSNKQIEDEDVFGGKEYLANKKMRNR